MSYIDPGIRRQFDSLSMNLKNEILARNVRLNNLNDLIGTLNQIVEEGEYCDRLLEALSRFV